MKRALRKERHAFLCLFLFPTHLQTLFANLLSNRYLRLVGVMILVGCCLWTIRDSGAFGISRLLARYSLAHPDVAIVEKAIKLAPADPQAHFAAAGVLSSFNKTAEAAVEMERAIALRPADFSLWLQLGLLRDQLGETSAALAAFDEAVRLAPFYARPRWQRGNLLLRAGRYEQSFADLGYAAQSNPELLPALMGLAWNISKGDPNLTEQWSQVKTDAGRIAFARFLAGHGRPKEAIAQLRAVAVIPQGIRRQLVEELVANSAFEDAFEIWTAGQGQELANQQPTIRIHDGGFEAPLTFDANGFGWRLTRNQKGITLSVNSSQPHTGSRNLRIDFSGDSNPREAVISQLILVQSNRSYQINFAYRTQDVVTGGQPLLVVTDAQGERKQLGQSAPLTGANDWKVVSFQFSTGLTTTAVVLSILRENCSTSPCPIFGSLSLDSFSVVQVR